MDPSEKILTDQSAAAAAPARKRETEVAEAETAREARILRLRQQVAEGQYQVDAAELSARLIAKHLAK
jgi:anti-sigma28 factor (negative regulator of flagellin synthesis)